MIVTAIFINCGTLLSCACLTQSSMTFSAACLLGCRTHFVGCCARFSSVRSLDARAKPIIEGRLRHLLIPIFLQWVKFRDFPVCQRACALMVRTTVRPFCAIWTPQCGGKRESCVYSSAKINLLFRIEEVFAKQFSDFLRTVVMIDKNKWTFFRMLSCFVSFLASFGGKRAPFSSRSVGGCPSRV